MPKLTQLTPEQMRIKEATRRVVAAIGGALEARVRTH